MPRKANLTPSGNYFLAKNIVEVNTTGFETDVQYQQNFGRSSLLTSIGFIWVNNKNNVTVPSLYLTSYAKFLTNFNVQIATPWFSIGVNGLYKQRDPQVKATDASNIAADVSHDYFVLNGKLEGFLVKNKLSAFVEADNVLDRSYSDVLGTIMPGRWFMGGLKLSLSK
jgi:vitamin B12 transporter